MKCVAIKNILVNDNSNIENIKRIGEDKKNYIFIGDTFECDKEVSDKLIKLGLIKILEEKKTTKSTKKK